MDSGAVYPQIEAARSVLRRAKGSHVQFKSDQTTCKATVPPPRRTPTTVEDASRRRDGMRQRVSRKDKERRRC